MIKKDRTLFNIINTALLEVINKTQTPIISLFYHERIFPVYGFFNRLLFETKRNNLGDDLNKDFFEACSGKVIVRAEYTPSFIKKRIGVYSLVGSVLEYVCKQPEAVTVWGTGFKYKNSDLTPADIARHKYLAVRGPLSRDIILRNGGDCPPIYGDPIILLSKYMPLKIEKKYKYGVIPHKLDFNRSAVHNFADRPNYRLINIFNYSSWLELIKEILSCDYILSSSLHGIIIADSYKIPNIWVRFSDFVDGDGFKFNDYFLGAKKYAECVDCSRLLKNHEIDVELEKWQASIVDPVFEESCPLQLHRYLVI